MVHIRQPFLSIITAVVFSLLGLIMAQGAVNGSEVMLAQIKVSSSVAWAMSGLMFLLAYFSLVHLQD